MYDGRNQELEFRSKCEEILDSGCWSLVSGKSTRQVTGNQKQVTLLQLYIQKYMFI